MPRRQRPTIMKRPPKRHCCSHLTGPASVSSSNSPNAEGTSAVFSSTHTKNPPRFCTWGRNRMANSGCALARSSALGGKNDRFTGEGSFEASFPAGISRFSESVTTQVESPFPRERLGKWAETSTNRTAPSLCRQISRTTASFSSGFSEHVLYTILPPILRSFTARAKMATWRECSDCAYRGDHDAQSSGDFRYGSLPRLSLTSVPSPLQGTSQRMRSNCCDFPAIVGSGKCCAK